MATLACVLGVRLRKPGDYDLNPDAALPTLEDGERAVTLVFRVALVAAVLAIALGAALEALARTVGVGA